MSGSSGNPPSSSGFAGDCQYAGIKLYNVNSMHVYQEQYDGIVFANKINGRIEIENRDIIVSFSRKLYAIGTEDQWHFDYKAKLKSDVTNLLRLLGQTWEVKNFEHKSGAFKWLDGEEEDYRIQSNDIFGDDFSFNKFVPK